MLIIAPLHSITSPTVGVGYLATALREHGHAGTIRDVNIALHAHLQNAGIESEILDWLFPYGERTYGGELLMSNACFGHEHEDVHQRARRVPNASFQEFYSQLRRSIPTSDTRMRQVQHLIARYLCQSASDIAAEATTWVGFSVVATNQAAVIVLTRMVRAIRPDVRIVLGGPHFHKHNARAWLDVLPEADAVIVGDALTALPRWLNDDHEVCDQVVQRVVTRPAIRHAPREPFRAMYADWSDIDWSAYVNVTAENAAEARSTAAAIPIVGARGCSYNRCTFCYEVLLEPRYRPRSVADVVDEVCYQRDRFGRNEFFFTDLDLNSSRDRVFSLSASLRARAPGLRFHCWLRAHDLDADILGELYSAGCRTWFVGVEAVTDNLLALMQKGYDGDHARRVVTLMHQFSASHADLRYGFNLIPGYPGETLADVETTLDRIIAACDEYRGRVAALYDFTLTQNTIAWQRRETLGLRNIVGWNEVIFPPDLAGLPSHRYWYERDEADLGARLLLWDYVRLLVGQQGHYVDVSAPVMSVR